MLRFYTYDVFTQQRYAGNPLAIVEAAESLTTAQMQTIAAEFNLSETIFVMPPRDSAHDARVRIFFPTAEIPFAGHPTLGCAVHLAAAKYGSGDFTGDIVLEEEAGIVPVTLWRQGGVTSGRFTAPVLPHPADPGTAGSQTGGTVDPAAVAAALGLTPGQVGFDGHQPGVWQGGPNFAYIPLADAAALAAARPVQPHWDSLTAACGSEALYLYIAGGSVADYRARMFAPTHGVAEDPATGSATAIFAAQLLAQGVLAEGQTDLRLRQGVEMGRPSDLGLRVDVADGALRRVQVSGSAVPVTEGRLTPPD